MGALMLVYVGVEIGLASWISTYLGITTGMLAQYGAWATSAYWAALAVGRLVGAAASRTIGRMPLLGIALGGSLLGGVGLFLSHGPVLPTILCLVWIAFFYATVYPTTVALAASEFPRRHRQSRWASWSPSAASARPCCRCSPGSCWRRSTRSYLWFVVAGLGLLPLLLLGISRLSHTAARMAS